MPQALTDYVAYYLPLLKSANSANAIHALMEADEQIVPILIDTYQTEPRPTHHAAPPGGNRT